MKILKNILIFLAMLIAVSCEDFMNPESLSTFDNVYIYSNADDARLGVNSIYVQFSHDGFRSRLSNNMTGCTDIEHNGGTSDGARYQIWRLDARENNGDLAYVWNIAYQAIRDANIAIEGIENSEAFNAGDVAVAKEMHHLLGAAYTLRAYWYSMLIFYFGDVPFMIQAPKAGVEFNLPKTDRNEILTVVIQDLIDVEEGMKWADEARYGIEEVNREYTIGMIARLALQRGGWYLKPDMTMAREDDYLTYYQLAKNYCQKLIELKGRELPKDFRQIFLNQCTYRTPVNDEILFEVPFAKGEGDVGWNIGIRVDGGTTAKHDYGSGSNYMAIPPTYLYSFDTLDIRLPVTCGLYTINVDNEKVLVSTGNMNISQGKWSRHLTPSPLGRTTDKGTAINWPIMRYADVILMLAEAENTLNGPTDIAKNALKRVRQRAFIEDFWPEKVDQYVDSVSASKETFFRAIVNERAWEFGGEMIRKYELIRWNIYFETIDQMLADIKKMADEAYDGTGTLPDYLYVKNDENGDLIIYNLFRKILVSPDDTWTKKSWLINMKSATTGLYQEWIARDYANYKNPVRYIFPIPTVGIDNSNGVLKNDGYGFGN